MSLRDLLGLYALVGIACAIAVFRRAPKRSFGAVVSAIATVPLWPLWAPFALAPSRPRAARPESDAVLARVDRALVHTVSITGLTVVVIAVYLIIVVGLGSTPSDADRQVLGLSMIAAAIAAGSVTSSANASTPSRAVTK